MFDGSLSGRSLNIASATESHLEYETFNELSITSGGQVGVKRNHN
jgi:hypothetical protein